MRWDILVQGIDKAELVKEVKQALYASKITSYAQGLNIIKAKSAEKGWDVDVGSMARIWKVRPDQLPYAVQTFTLLAATLPCCKRLLQCGHGHLRGHECESEIYAAASSPSACA